MRARKLEVRIRSMKEELDELDVRIRDAIAGKPVKPRETLSSPSEAAMMSVLTPSRLFLLKVIRRRKPKSIYELAKLVERDRKAVTDDVQILKRLGLINLRRTKVGKRAYTEPTAPYSSLHFDVEL